MNMNINKSIFTYINELALRYGAVNLGQGFPDHEPPQHLIESVHKALESSSFQYFPSAGLLPLREIISEILFKDWNVHIDPDTEITITAGATQGLADAIRSQVCAGDEVILVDPSYDSYAPVIESFGARCVRVPMKYGVDKGFEMNWELLEQKVTTKTKLIILNNPHNPSGYLMNPLDYHFMDDLMSRNPHLHLLGDEVYAHIVFEGSFHTFLQMTHHLERIMVVHSFGKTYHCTGWKLGFVAGSASWMSKFRKAHEYNVFCVNSLLQRAFSDFLANDFSRHTIAKFYQKQRDLLIDKLKIGPFQFKPVQSTYFQWIDYSKWADSQINTKKSVKTDMKQAEQWCMEAGCAMIPFSPFVDPLGEWNHKLMRLCFAKSEEKINLAFENLYAYLD